MVIDWEALKKRHLFHLLIDSSMILLALIHIGLIIFDATYFRFRDFYYHNLPGLSHRYDQLKAVEPHRDTQIYLDMANRFFKNCHDNTLKPKFKEVMVEKSTELIKSNYFHAADKTGHLVRIKQNMVLYMREHTGKKYTSSRRAFRDFWRQGCLNLSNRESFFNDDIAHYIETNYYRPIDKNGQPVDYFFWIDLCFILIFLIEFLVMWRKSIQELGPDQKVLYPIYHWYDILSCIPLQQLRFLRLLRLIPLYYRMVQSDIITIEKTTIYKVIMHYKEIIVEEISDQVSLNILSNIQEKTKLGTNRKLMEELITTYKPRLKEVVKSHIGNIHLPKIESKREEFVEFLAELFHESIKETDEYKRMARIPGVSSSISLFINQQTIAKLIDQSIDSFLFASQRALADEETEIFVDALMEDILNQTVIILSDEATQQLTEDINIQVLEELKKSSTAKIWKIAQAKLKEETKEE